MAYLAVKDLMNSDFFIFHPSQSLSDPSTAPIAPLWRVAACFRRWPRTFLHLPRRVSVQLLFLGLSQYKTKFQIKIST